MRNGTYLFRVIGWLPKSAELLCYNEQLGVVAVAARDIAADMPTDACMILGREFVADLLMESLPERKFKAIGGGTATVAVGTYKLSNISWTRSMRLE